jgi:hypothetical protein
MPFSEMLDLVKAPTAPTSAPPSAIGDIARLATAGVALYKEQKSKSIVGEAAQEMSDFETTLATAKRQGKISITEYQSRLNAKQRELTANYPGLAQDIKAGIQEQMGFLPSQEAAKSVIETEKSKTAEWNKQVSDAHTAGFDLKKADGTPDDLTSVQLYNALKMNLSTLDVETKQLALYKARNEQEKIPFGDAQKMQEATYLKAFQKHATIYYKPLLQQAEDILNDASLNDDVAYKTAFSLAANAANDFHKMAGNKMAMDGILGSEAQRGTLSNIEGMTKRDFDNIFTGERASTKLNIIAANRQIENEEARLGSLLAPQIALSNRLGQNMSIMTASAGATPQQQQAVFDAVTKLGTIPDPNSSTNNLLRAAQTPTSADSIPLAEGSDFVTRAANSVTDYSKAGNLGPKDVRSMTNLAYSSSEYVVNNGTSKDTMAMIKRYGDPLVYQKIESNEDSTAKEAAYNSFQRLSAKGLRIGARNIHNDYADIKMDLSKGYFVAVPNPDKIEAAVGTRSALEPSFLGDYLGNFNTNTKVRLLQRDADDLNKALHMAVVTHPMRDKVPTKELTQHIAEIYGYGFTDNSRKRGFSDAVKELLAPEVPATPPSPAPVSGAIDKYTWTPEGGLVKAGQ